MNFDERMADIQNEYYIEFGDGFGFRMAHKPFTLLCVFSWRTYSFYQGRWLKNKVDGCLDLPPPIDAPLLTYTDLIEKGYLVNSGYERDPEFSIMPAGLRYNINTKFLNPRVNARLKTLAQNPPPKGGCDETRSDAGG